MTEYIENMPQGPLDLYRKKATFDWKLMKIFVHGQDALEYEHKLCEAIKNSPEFQNKKEFLNFDEQRRTTAKKDLALADLEIASLVNILEDPRKAVVFVRVMIQCNPSLVIRQGIRIGVFCSTIQSLGTEKHWRYIDLIYEKKIFGTFCLTEIGHGSNTKGMRTTATYNKATKQFVLNSPDFEAAKCWSAALGQMATHAVVFAQLYIENVHYGLHAFVVPIRDPKTLIPYPGLLVGDMGEKIGLNGIDNGFIMFENYCIPRECLLNKNADVTEDGQYKARLKNAHERHGAALGGLSFGRVTIIGICESLGIKALTIAIRYAGVRKQFGPDGKAEIPILEYQSHQYRLLPYLAAAYALRIFATFFIPETYSVMVDAALGQNDRKVLSERGMEIHVICSAAKPLSSWLFRDAIQECREACGGHGYLNAAGFGSIQNDEDANCTYEGDNQVLIQQTSNWLIRQWPEIKLGHSIKTPLHSADFLTNALKILNLKFSGQNYDDLTSPETIIEAYQWLTCYLIKEAAAKVDGLNSQQGDFWAKNNSQVFYLKDLAIAFIQHFVLQTMLTQIKKASDDNIKNALSKLFSLYALWSLEKHVGTFYEGGYFQSGKTSHLIKETILQLCSEIKDDAVSLIDAIAPPDFILNSVLGNSDGQVYQHLKSAIFRSPYAMSRPSWWQEIVNWRNNSYKNKL